MCPICNVTDGALHHYDCPYDETIPEKRRRKIVQQGSGNEKPSKSFLIKWQTASGWVTVK